MSLPPLPIPELPDNIYADDQIRQYGALCRKQALEDAAHVCDNEKWDHQTGAHSIRFIDTYNGACDDCMKAIGRLS